MAERPSRPSPSLRLCCLASAKEVGVGGKKRGGGKAAGQGEAVGEGTVVGAGLQTAVHDHGAAVGDVVCGVAGGEAGGAAKVARGIG